MPDEILPATEYTNRKFDRQVLSGKHIAAAEFAASSFFRCKFAETTLEKCRFTDCLFDECDLSLVQLPECTFSKATFKDTRAIGVDWTRANWPHLGRGTQIIFTGCAISHSTFIGLSLREIQFIHCTATNVDFREADLGRASFADTDLSESLFLNTDLTHADFSLARNYRIDPGRNRIARARFSLPEAVSLLYSMDIEMVDSP